MPPRRRGGDHAKAAATTSTAIIATGPRQRTRDQHSSGIPAVPVVSAIRIPASGRRSLDVDWVRVCAFCPDGNHLHRVNGDDPIRRSGCGRGKYYIVAVVETPRAQPGTAA
jgi:hypothetical protein